MEKGQRHILQLPRYLCHIGLEYLGSQGKKEEQNRRVSPLPKTATGLPK